MKKWAVSYINFFDNRLMTTFIEAETELEALYYGDLYWGLNFRNNIDSVEDFEQECFDCDCMMHAEEVR